MKIISWALLGFIVITAIAYFGLTETRAGQDFLLSRLTKAAMQSQAATEEPFNGLRVFMCGTASPLPAPGRAQACVAVIAGEDIYLVDAGARSPSTFALNRLPLNNLRAIFVTHFHSDHIAALGDFNLMSWVAGRPEPLEIIGPAGIEQVVSGFNEAYALDRSYRIAHHGADMLPPELGVMNARTITPDLVLLEENGVKVTAILVNHNPVEPAVGYRFDYKGRSVVVSGDSNVVESLQTASQGVDLLLHDALSLPIVKALETAARDVGSRMAKIFLDIQDYHASITSVIEMGRKAEVKQLALYHLVPAPQNFLMEKIFKRDLPADVIVTEDAMVFDLPANSDEIIVR